MELKLANTDSENNAVPPPIAPDGGASNQFRPVWRFVMLMAAISVPYLYIVTAGFSQRSIPYSWPSYTDYYSRLTQAFLHGQVSLIQKPGPELLALADPYDPIANHRLAPHDVVLFKGKYYYYWGPTPALLAAMVCKLIGVDHPTFGDQYLVFGLMLATVGLCAALIFRIRAEFFPTLNPKLAELAILSLGLGSPVLFTMARPAVYEVAILSGQVFLLAGVLLAWMGMGGGRPKWTALLAAGVCLALSCASRVSLVPACLIIALLAGWRSWQLRRTVMPVVAVLLPLVCCGLLLAWYNLARFGSITEFGVRYQLAATNQHAKAMSEYSSLRFIPINLDRYLFAPPQILYRFPGIFASDQAPWIARFFTLPEKYGYESLVGLLWCQPFLLLATVGAAWPILSRSEGNAPVDRPAKLWLTLTLISAAWVGIAPALTIAGDTMRYLLDAVPGCTILAALGFLLVLSRVRSARARVWIERSAVAVVIGQLFLAIPLGLVGYYDQLARFNPMLNDMFVKLFNRL